MGSTQKTSKRPWAAEINLHDNWARKEESKVQQLHLNLLQQQLNLLKH